MKPVLSSTSSRFPGFSMVELMTVLLIVAVTAVITIPLGINYVRSYQATAASQAVASNLQYTRAQSVKRNCRNGLILNIDWPNPGEFQFTTLEANPRTGANDSYFPGPGATAVFNPSNPDYGRAPDAGGNYNTNSPGSGDPSPHGTVMQLPMRYQFTTTNGTFSSLLFRSNGTVAGVRADGVAARMIRLAANNLDYEIDVQGLDTGLSRTIRISTNGRVTVLTP